MNFNEYQSQAAKTAIYPDSGTTGIYYTALGLFSEAGEVAGKVKKMLRDDHGTLTSDRREAILAEIGDVLWYAAMLAYELGESLDDIAAANITKLLGRAERGTLGGDGDVR